MANSLQSSLPSHARLHLLFAVLGLASIALFWAPLQQLVALSLSDRPYSYILVIPVISAFVLYLERRKEFARIAFRPGVGLPVLMAALAMYGLFALQVVHIPAEYLLSVVVLALILVWAAAFTLCYGLQTLRAALFPLLLLLLLVPIPSHLMDKIVSSLQWGSAEATYGIFKLIGVPMFRDGVRFELPGIGIEIAEECSSIHSACALFITALLIGHLFLKSLRMKVCLSLLSLPVAMFTNAVRIVTIWFLATKVDVGFLYGNLHRNGGILFSLISLSVLMGSLNLLRKLERPGQHKGVAGEDQVSSLRAAETKPVASLD
jgi:exosortase